jgi:hypothetical protein
MENLKVFYHDTRSILVINPKGRIRKLYTPFKVQCITLTGRYAPGRWVYVEEVQSSQADQLIYLINGSPYPHHYFRITIRF